jgi:hypothetical protein
MQRAIIAIMALSTLVNAQTKINQLEPAEDFSQKSILFHNTVNGTGFASTPEMLFAVPSLSVENARSHYATFPLTGILSHDLFASDSMNRSADSLAIHETRSAMKSGFFSLMIPGAGQAYNGNLMKAAGFLAVEITGWVANAIWTKKGNDETNAFRVYADGTAVDDYQDGHYNVYRYAQWIVDNYQQLEQNCGTSSSNQAIISQQINYVLITKTYDPTKAPWTQVNWVALNYVENAMGGSGPENSFSHYLFPYGDVEYYKEIAKYPQFRAGWYDENLSYLTYDQLRSLTPESNYYENMRGTATGFYDVALAGLCVVIANHFASAAEAMIWAHGHNKTIETNIGISPLPQGMGFQSEINLAVHF